MWDSIYDLLCRKRLKGQGDAKKPKAKFRCYFKFNNHTQNLQNLNISTLVKIN